MHEIDTIGWAVAGAVAAVGIGVTALAMLRSWRSERTYEEELEGRVKGMRMHRMLLTMGVGIRNYLRRHRSLDVERHLVKCNYCPDPDRCDRYLEKRGGDDPNEFCPNYPELSRGRR